MSKVKVAFLVKLANTESGESEVHVKNIGPTDHATVCGMDGGLSDGEFKIIPLKRGDKMDCISCRIYYENRHGLNLKKEWLSN